MQAETMKPGADPLTGRLGSCLRPRAPGGFAKKKGKRRKKGKSREKRRKKEKKKKGKEGKEERRI